VRRACSRRRQQRKARETSERNNPRTSLARLVALCSAAPSPLRHWPPFAFRSCCFSLSALLYTQTSLLAFSIFLPLYVDPTRRTKTTQGRLCLRLRNLAQSRLFWGCSSQRAAYHSSTRIRAFDSWVTCIPGCHAQSSAPTAPVPLPPPVHCAHISIRCAASIFHEQRRAAHPRGGAEQYGCSGLGRRRCGDAVVQGGDGR
jgi:hypothetical protein